MSPDTDDTFSRRIREHRVAARLGQVDVARRIGRSQPIVSHWETGRREPTLADLSMLAGVLHTSVDDLLGTSLRASVRRRSSKAYDQAVRKRFGHELRLRRLARGVTARDLRAASGITGRRLRRIEDGQDPTIAEMIELRDVLGGYDDVVRATKLQAAHQVAVTSGAVGGRVRLPVVAMAEPIGRVAQALIPARLTRVSPSPTSAERRGPAQSSTPSRRESAR